MTMRAALLCAFDFSTRKKKLFLTEQLCVAHACADEMCMCCVFVCVCDGGDQDFTTPWWKWWCFGATLSQRDHCAVDSTQYSQKRRTVLRIRIESTIIIQFHMVGTRES